jgi:hypothetical protein
MLSRTPQKGRQHGSSSASTDTHELAELMRIQLVRKLADHLDGVDVSRYREGDVFELSRREAELLIAERWAVSYEPVPKGVRRVSVSPQMAVAADRLNRRTLDQIRRVREEMETRHFEEQERRRAEDRIRDALHDERAKTLNGD